MSAVTRLPVYKLYLPLLLILFAKVSLAQSANPDSITVAIEPHYNKVSATHRFFLGENYRQLWAAPVKMRVFNLNKEKGGLKVLERGGGMQTKSLRMESADGREWVLRTIQKNPESVLPATLRPTIARDIIQDHISAANPYAFLVVPPLADALQIPHAHPEIVYVPDDPAFGKFQKEFANQVFLFEEREPLDADKTDNTVKAKVRLQKDNDNRVNQQLVLRARLLDMLLGDWDRHEDQWRWKRTEGPKGSLYEPVPRDRDQVFYKPGGVLPWLISRNLLMAKFQPYGDHIRSINRWNLNARNFDRYFLNGLSEADWKVQIEFVQKALSNQLIDSAIKLMPDTIYRLCGQQLTKNMMARRNILERQALKYYRFLSQTVDITATDKQERLEVAHLPGGLLKVSIYKLKKDSEKGAVVYQRTFYPAVTKEIRLYGLGGKDVFSISGTKRSSIIVRLIGGDDADTFEVDSALHNRHKILVYDRSDQSNTFPSGSRARLLTSTDSTVNQPLKADYKYNFLQPLFLAAYNKDYGFQLIGDFIYQKQGFRKEPYASRQSLLVNYGFGTSSLLLNYRGDFKKAIGKNDISINLVSKGPNYQNNFFGTGNQTVFNNLNEESIRYYRNIYSTITADAGLYRTYGHWRISGSIAAQYYSSAQQKNTNKLLNAFNLANPDQQVFSKQLYAGLMAGAALNTRNNGTLSRKGIYWNTTLTGMNGLNQQKNAYGQIFSEFSFYKSLGKDSGLVVANRTGLGTTLGEASYFQQFKLGGSQNLRGFYNWRFTGKSMAYNNLELRLKLFDFNSYLLPGTVGLIGFNDVGRVWSPGEKSVKWHDGYGGGLSFFAAQLVLIQASVGFSKEGAYPYISAGFGF